MNFLPQNSEKKKLEIIEIIKASELEELNKKIKKAGRAAIYLSDDGQSGLKANFFGLLMTCDGEKIYHLPGCGSYAKTQIDESHGERWFCTETEAQTAGWRKALNCP